MIIPDKIQRIADELNSIGVDPAGIPFEILMFNTVAKQHAVVRLDTYSLLHEEPIYSIEDERVMGLPGGKWEHRETLSMLSDVLPKGDDG